MGLFNSDRRTDYKVAMSDGSTSTVHASSQDEAEKTANATQSGIAIGSVQVRDHDTADNLRNGGMNL